MSAPSTALPLNRYPLFQTNDVDDARDRVARVFCPHRLTPRPSNQDVDVRHNRVALDGLSLNAMGYGAEIAIEPGTLGSFFLLQLPLKGGARVHVGRRQLDASPSCGTLISPTVDISMVWSDGCEKLLLQIERDRLRHCFEALMDRPMPAAPLEFEPAFPSVGTPSSSIVELIELWRRDLDDGDGLLAQGITGAHMSEAMMTALLLHHPHTYSASLEQPSAAIVPRHVRRAEEFMRANLDRRISFAQVAEAAGVSLRALQSGFQQFRGASPSSTFRAMRLEAARRDLLSGAVPSVTAAALKWGFPHLGRFAIAYGATYGSSPSSDLHRSRAKARKGLAASKRLAPNRR